MSDITPSVDSTVNVPPTASVAESTVVLSTPEMFNPSTLSAPPSPPTPTFTPSNPDIGGANDGNNGSSVFGQGTSSASLYLYTFLATLVLLLAISAAIVFRSLILRRRHRQLMEEAIRNGTWVPPQQPPPRVKVDLSKKPKMHEIWCGGGLIGPIASPPSISISTAAATTTTTTTEKPPVTGFSYTSTRLSQQKKQQQQYYPRITPQYWEIIKPFAAAYVVTTESATGALADNGIDGMEANNGAAAGNGSRRWFGFLQGGGPSSQEQNQSGAGSSEAVTAPAPPSPRRGASRSLFRRLIGAAPPAAPSPPLPPHQYSNPASINFNANASGTDVGAGDQGGGIELNGLDGSAVNGRRGRESPSSGHRKQLPLPPPPRMRVAVLIAMPSPSNSPLAPRARGKADPTAAIASAASNRMSTMTNATVVAQPASKYSQQPYTTTTTTTTTTAAAAAAAAKSRHLSTSSSVSTSTTTTTSTSTSASAPILNPLQTPSHAPATVLAQQSHPLAHANGANMGADDNTNTNTNTNTNANTNALYDHYDDDEVPLPHIEFGIAEVPMVAWSGGEDDADADEDGRGLVPPLMYESQTGGGRGGGGFGMGMGMGIGLQLAPPLRLISSRTSQQRQER